MTNWIHRAGAAVGLMIAGCLMGCADGAVGRDLSAVPVTELTASGASNPTVAVASDGDVTFVSWVETRDGESNVFLKAAGAAGVPGAPVRVNDIPGDAAPHAQAPAQVATGPGGEVYVVWQNRTDVEYLDYGASDVRFSRSTDGGRTWSSAITVNDNPADMPARNTFEDIATGPEGTIYVSWIDARVRDSYRGEVYEEGESAPADEAPEGGMSHHGAEPGTQIRVAHSTDGGLTFSPSVVLEKNSCPCCRTSIATAPDGTVYVSWRKIYEGSVRDIAVARSSDGGTTFSEPVRVHEDGWVFPGCPHAGADLVVDATGRVHVAWYTGAEGGAGAFYAVSDDGGRTFSEPTRLTPPDATITTQVSLAADEDGTVWIAWEDPEGAVPTIRLARADGGGGLERVETGAPPGMLPSLAASDSTLALAWLDGQSARLLETTHVD